MEKERMQNQIEHSQSKYVGTGHSDTTKYEWMCNQHRDTYASIVSHHSLLSYVSVAENQSIGRTRFTMLERMCDPCGPPPPADRSVTLTEDDIKPTYN